MKKILPTLKIDNMGDFIKKFVETTRNLTPEETAELVWNFANSRWTDGYDYGKNDDN